MNNHSFDRVIIYSADRSYEADIIRGILRSNGIMLLRMPDYSTGLFGVLVNLHVAVARKDVEEARDILSAFGIDQDDPLKTHLPYDILRAINNFFPRENWWIKLYAKIVFAMYFLFFVSSLGARILQ